MKMTQAIVVALALLVGTAIGWFHHPASEPAAPAESGRPAKAPIADGGDKAALEALREQVRELKLRLAEAEAKARLATNAPAEQALTEERGNRRRERGPDGFREAMQRMRQENPERYAEMTNRMAQMRARQRESAQSKKDCLAAIDTSKMNEGQKRVHDDLLSLMTRREELEDRLHSEDLSEEQRRALFQELHEDNQTLRKLNADERATLLAQAAESLGYTGDDAAEITATIQDIIDLTETRGGPMH